MLNESVSHHLSNRLCQHHWKYLRYFFFLLLLCLCLQWEIVGVGAWACRTATVSYIVGEHQFRIEFVGRIEFGARRIESERAMRRTIGQSSYFVASRCGCAQHRGKCIALDVPFLCVCVPPSCLVYWFLLLALVDDAMNCVFLYFFFANQKVRNAIQALQEMTYSTLASQMDLGGRFPPARSIPNLPNETCSMVQSVETYALARSSSQPAEMWGRNMIARNDHIHHYGESAENVMAAAAAAAAAAAVAASKPVVVSAATQTDTKIDLPAIEKFIVSNPRLVLNLLGIIEPSYQFECELQPQTLIPIPEADVSSPEATSPPESHAKKFTFGVGGGAGSSSISMETTSSPPVTGVWNSPHNSNNKNTEHCRSTDALLGTSSDDCLLPSDENVMRIQALPEPINFTIVREGSTKSRNVVTNCSRSSSMNSLSSTTQTTPKQSITDLSSTATASQRNHHGHPLKRKQSWKDNNNLAARKSSSAAMAATSPTDCLNFRGNDAGIDPEDDNTNFDELSEKCALLCNDVRKNSNGRSSTSTSDIQKRNHLVPRPPYSYRFSAGDADKLEKGIKNIPSTRSLKDSWIHTNDLMDGK